MKWALVLHFYQPPVQDLSITKQVLDSSYMPVLRLLRDNPNIRITANISACLLEQLHKLQKWEFFDLVKYLFSRGQMELLSSPAYHPVLPLCSRDDFELQMKESEWIYYDTLGFLPGKGFFFPEMAVDRRSVEFICNDFYSHTLVDTGAVDAEIMNGLVCGKKVFVNNRQLTDLVRSYPDRLSAKKLSKWIINQPGEYIVSVNDVEAFGHHYEERLEVLRDLFHEDKLDFVRLDGLGDYVSDRVLEIKPSSWQEANGMTGPFQLWSDEKNYLQKGYLDFANLVRESLWSGKEKTEPLTWDAAARFFSAGLSSCYMYWLSQWPWWHPELAQKGAEQLIKSLRSLSVDRDLRLKGERMYHAWLSQLWERHWSGEVEKLHKLFDTKRSEYISKLPVLD